MDIVTNAHEISKDLNYHKWCKSFSENGIYGCGEDA